LFSSGVAAFERKQFAEALPLFEKSYAREEALGTLLYLADCHAQLGHTATAWTLFRTAATKATRASDKRATAATERVKTLEKSLAYLTVTLAPNGPADQELRRDGQIVPPAERSAATPVDPGKHTLELSAPGRVAVRREIDVRPATTSAVELPALESVPAAAASTSPAKTTGAAPTSPATTSPPSDSAPPTATPFPLRTAAYVAGIAGLAVAGVGTYVALSSTSTANDAAAARTFGSRAAYDDARDTRTIGLVVLGVGGALTAASVVTLALLPSSASASTSALRVGPTAYGPGLQVGGRF
jgi:hypothetical protein